ncbi:unnamed protein product [Penicillium nalgiovense]|uniref:Uncharacterized protein n=1 Tax=Penicillium nalgiovense TaxID=60175 RepID=A0A9W4IQR6_PENNA|nr:unnamed protein product [Penicillium nalgiovense]CAG7993107.1 unnamed protein product [Penicillium nalgiovense]CAG8027816.1 unnamed protein product [Penicillium nalgiovense]CAG8043169.1 unnamed protein product [Penicillium nalgiovense]CAG8046113.1 unnamed protein product [Penicillium nalgiovense]
MSQNTNSQNSLDAPAEIVPSTPVRRATLSPSPELSAMAKRPSSQSDKKFLSPPPLSSSDMTPPPSSQIPGAPLRSRSHSRSLSPSLAKPTDLDKSLCDAYGASENLPTLEEIDNASETQLRTIAKELLTVARESRMSALHFKLQNSLVSFASNEAVKRAEVEHQLAKREVEIIQSAEYRSRSHPTDPITPKQSQSTLNSDYLSAVQRSQELEELNTVLDRRLRKAKRAIDEATSRSMDLEEQNLMLKRRIGDNRKHFSQIFNYGSMSPSTQNDIHNICHGEHADGLAALLYADKLTNQTHAYGTHSATSVPVTPNHSKGQYLTPIGHPREDHYDSDSTVSLSASEAAEEALASPQHMRSTVPKSSTLLQTKLFGQVQKPGVERSRPGKRKADSDANVAATKKSRATNGIGLGINA